MLYVIENKITEFIQICYEDEEKYHPLQKRQVSVNQVEVHYWTSLWS